MVYLVCFCLSEEAAAGLAGAVFVAPAVAVAVGSVAVAVTVAV